MTKRALCDILYVDNSSKQYAASLNISVRYFIIGASLMLIDITAATQCAYKWQSVWTIRPRSSTGARRAEPNQAEPSRAWWIVDDLSRTTGNIIITSTDIKTTQTLPTNLTHSVISELNYTSETIHDTFVTMTTLQQRQTKKINTGEQELMVAMATGTTTVAAAMEKRTRKGKEKWNWNDQEWVC